MIQKLKHSSRLTLVLLLLVPYVSFSTTVEKAHAATLKNWYARVSSTYDGDTFNVTWSPGYEHPEGKTAIRVVGIDTNETDPNPSNSECYAEEAKTRLAQLLPINTGLRLRARDIDSETLGRPLRHVYYGPGYTTSLAYKMVYEGYGLPSSYSIEPDFRTSFFRAGELAMINQRGMWQPAICGGPTYDPDDLGIFVNYDADGDDRYNVNGEYIELINNGTATLSIGNWTVRSSGRLADQTKKIPSGRSIAPGNKHTIYFGFGTNNSTKTYLGYSTPQLNNESDSIYIRDTYLNVRAANFWPCTYTCAPGESVIVEDVRYDASGDDSKNPNGEWIRLRNVGKNTVDLTNWRVQDNGGSYTFASGTTIAPGKRFILYIGKGTSSSSIKYWGNSKGILNNSGNDIVKVLNPSSVEVDCYSWGSTNRCKSENIRGAVRVYANFNASGNDNKNPNGEWVSLHNTSGSTVNIGGYSIHSPGHTSYTFPSSTKIGAGQNLRVRVGKGTKTTYNHYWGKSAGIMNNGGEYVEFRSPSNDTLVRHTWPCKISCGYRFGLSIDQVNYNAPGNDNTNPNGEWISIKNTSSAVQDLRNWKIKVGPYQLVSIASRKLDPGESIRIYIGKGKNTSAKMYWGKSKGILLNSGSREVELQSPLRHDVDCYSWGRGSCK